tara:strand:+ start:101 stop:472 length:372 start_codon:yes stop_codon:yes gene_type:complete
MPNYLMNFDDMNVSCQVGDIIHYSHSGLNTGGFDNTALINTLVMGPILAIIDNTATGGGWDVIVDHNTSAPVPTAGDYITFAKDKRANTSSLLGYYASVNFVNNSHDKVELFSVGSEISESSK